MMKRDWSDPDEKRIVVDEAEDTAKAIREALRRLGIMAPRKVLDRRIHNAKRQGRVDDEMRRWRTQTAERLPRLDYEDLLAVSVLVSVLVEDKDDSTENELLRRVLEQNIKDNDEPVA